MPKVSVITPTYNCKPFLSEAIESVLGQTFQDWELIIIDDGSTDNTRTSIEHFLKDQRIVYIYQDNRGLACARNTGFKAARGEYLALLDADDRWKPNRLEETVAALDAHPDVGLVHAHSLRITEDNKPIEVVKRDSRYLSGDLFKAIFLRQAQISCPTATFRKACLDTVGFMDENLARMGVEDREYWLRIARRYPVFFIDKVLAFYRIRQSSMSKDTSQMLKARLYVVDKYAPEGGEHRDLRRLALAKIYRDYGDELLLKKKHGEARQQYEKSLQYGSFSVYTMVNLIKCFLKN